MDELETRGAWGVSASGLCMTWVMTREGLRMRWTLPETQARPAIVETEALRQQPTLAA